MWGKYHYSPIIFICLAIFFPKCNDYWGTSIISVLQYLLFAYQIYSLHVKIIAGHLSLKVKLATFSIATFFKLLHWGIGKGATPFPWLFHFTLDPYFILLSTKQGGIKYHFFSLWYDSIWDWTLVSRTIGEHVP